MSFVPYSEGFAPRYDSPETIKHSILDNYNGRVNLLEPQDPTTQFKMMERIAIRNKATEYRNPLEGV